jgi:nitrile hydratase
MFAAGVVRPLGEFADPEDLAFARPPERRALYHVAFPQAALWPDGRADVELLVELYEHWLEPA